jgi:hypothetical protein
VSGDLADSRRWSAWLIRSLRKIARDGFVDDEPDHPWIDQRCLVKEDVA